MRIVWIRRCYDNSDLFYECKILFWVACDMYGQEMSITLSGFEWVGWNAPTFCFYFNFHHRWSIFLPNWYRYLQSLYSFLSSWYLSHNRRWNGTAGWYHIIGLHALVFFVVAVFAKLPSHCQSSCPPCMHQRIITIASAHIQFRWQVFCAQCAAWGRVWRLSQKLFLLADVSALYS